MRPHGCASKRKRADRRLTLLLALPLAGCAALSQRPASELRVGGSDTMGILTRRWAEEFMRLNPGIVVEAVGGGSGGGIAALIRGELDVSAASRAMLPEEVRRLHDRHGTLGVSHRCAKDALSIYLNPSNPIRALSLAQLEAIFTGRSRLWRDLGGGEGRIRLLSRPPSSGTYRLFRDLVLSDQPFAPDALTLPTTAAIVDAIRSDPEAIGYGGIAYGVDLVHARIEGVAPSPASVRSGTYPLARYLYLHTLRPPRGLAKRFIDWTLGPEGQRIVQEVGYVPLWAVAPPREPRGASGRASVEAEHTVVVTIGRPRGDPQLRGLGELHDRRPE